MTNSFKTFAATFLIVGTLFTDGYAQDMFARNTVKSPEFNSHIIVDGNWSTTTDDATDPVIVTKFSALFPNATNLKWTSSNDNLLVSFLNYGRKGNASFTAKGEMNFVIIECNMEQLPVAFCKSIKKDYASYQLFNAKEINAHGIVAYQAILESNTGFITLKYTYDGIELIQQVKKSGN